MSEAIVSEAQPEASSAAGPKPSHFSITIKRGGVSLLPPSVWLNDAADACVEARNYAHRTGHGVMAERLNYITDAENGLHVLHLGANNARHGPDKILEGLPVQLKYYETARASVDACFDRNGTFLYAKGTIIEVASEHGPEATKRLAERLRIPVSQARLFIRVGVASSKDARDLCKPLTLSSLRYDLKMSELAFWNTFACTTALTFVGKVAGGDSPIDAALGSLKIGAVSGVRAGATYILSGQMGRSGFERGLRPITRWTATQLGAHPNRLIGLAAGKKPGIEQTSKLLNGQIVAAVAATAIQSMPDMYRFATGKITGTEALKSVGTTTVNVGVQQIGGHIGAAVGTLAGAMISIGAAKIGGVAGRLAGEVVAAKIMAFVATLSFGASEEDNREIRAILEKVALEVATEQKLPPGAIDRYLSGVGQFVPELSDILHNNDREFCAEMCKRFCEFSATLEVAIELDMKAR